MFQNDELEFHLLTSPTIKSNSRVVAEWNLNAYENISYAGNYRFRPLEGPSSKFGHLPSFFDPDDAGAFYTNATNSDIVFDGGVSENGVPTLLQQPREQERFLYSLEDCFGRFRPRSGINKVRYGITEFIHHPNSEMARRPRYYMSHKDDNFKYWTSYRVENGVEYGVANASSVGLNHINDAAPFVVYESPVAANRLVVKMQTNIGDANLSPFFGINGRRQDPHFGQENSTTPSQWSIDVLVNNTWEQAIFFNPSNVRSNGSPIVGQDGYVELYYGLDIPTEFAGTFSFVATLSSDNGLPTTANRGSAYLVKKSQFDVGVFYVATGSGFSTFIPEYSWKLLEEGNEPDNSFVTNIGNPDYYLSSPVSVDTSERHYREFKNISGVRVSVQRMNKFGSVFDLIEISPRLTADITEIVSEFSVSKIASDLGSTGLPVGQLLASTGSMTIFDVEQAFNQNNPTSILPKHSLKNMKVSIYDVILNGNVQYSVPIKVMYADNFPVLDANTRKVTIDLRDLYFYLESLSAPDMLLTNVSVSHAIASLLDYIGFSNYTFKRLPGETEDIIPFFYSRSTQTIAEVLQDIAVSTQSSIFFDEYNNLSIMSRNYFMPNVEERETDLTLSGSELALFDEEDVDQNQDGFKIFQLPNIVSIASQQDSIFNDGKILYTSRYIQKSQANTAQSYMLDSQKTWVYKPVLLWEAAGEEQTKAQNEQVATQGSYALSAIPLKSDLSGVVPYVSGGQVLSNIIDLGEAIYFLGRYSGYFYANGEIIRFDAVEYSIPGVVDVVWISSVDEYQNYFSKIPFRGKMYPTGRIRVYSEPKYLTIDGRTVLREGAVEKHGRGQFGTTVTNHSAGVATTWTDGTRIKGIGINSKFIFDPIGTSEVSSLEALPPTIRSTYNSILVLKSDIKQLNEEINFFNIGLLSDPQSLAIQSSIQSLRQQIITKEQQVKQSMEIVRNHISTSTKYLDSAAALSQARRTEVTGKIKNFMSYSYPTEANSQSQMATETQMVQASALIVNGAASDRGEFSAINHVTYVHTAPGNFGPSIPRTPVKHTHFGTRMRVIGKSATGSESTQEPHGSMTYLTVETNTPEDKPNITGGSGGIAGLLNTANGEGYYYEIAALDADNVDKYGAANVFFYKVVSSGTDSSSSALPQLLWRGTSGIYVDSGDYIGQSRVFAQAEQSVYDIAFEYVDNVDGTRTFFLYLNGTQIGTVVDTTPISSANGSALFVRGTSKCMFENIYSMSSNFSETPSKKLDPVISSVFGTEAVTINDSFSKYSISGLVQSTYLSSIGSSGIPSYNIYYEEFGTILREAAYFNVQYDKAYPALYSRIVPNVSKIKTYTVSSYYGSPYNAEFLVFNTTDTVISLETDNAGALQIQGITFTQEANNELTVDDFYSKKSDLSNPIVEQGIVVSSPFSVRERYEDIKSSRTTYGRNEFTIEAPYIQSRDTANSLMKWISDRIMKPRKSVGVEVFSMPIIQLGDIVQVDYVSDEVAQVTGASRFVVYQIDYKRQASKTDMTVYLSEVS